MVDSHKNFAVSRVATAPSPANSGTSLVVTVGEGSRFPTPPFNAVVRPADQEPTPANAEVVRVTAISTDTFTITRAQEGSSARAIQVGDHISAAITAKAFTDIENALLPTHDATLHTDRTRRGPVHVVTATIYSATFSRPAFRDAQNDLVFLHFTLPVDYITGNVTLKVMLREEGTTGGTIRMTHSLSYWANGGGESVVIGAASFNQSIPVNAVATVLSVTLPSANAFTDVNYWYQLQRNGSDVNDTLADTVGFLGAWIEYTADM
jgi:hypothetical protein